jgi:hypothetical protein
MPTKTKKPVTSTANIPELMFSASPWEITFGDLWARKFPDIVLYHDRPLGLVDLNGKKRGYRGDFVEPTTKVVVEIQGGIYMRHRTGHTSVSGVKRDCHKFSLAALRGWAVFLLTPEMIDEQWVMAVWNCIKGRSGNVP